MIARAFKAGIIAAIGTALIAADEQPAPDYPEPPLIIAERIVDGRFEPGNFEYLRGHFPEASDEERRANLELLWWRADCLKQGRKKLDDRLAARGLSVADDRSLDAGPSLCSQVFAGSQFASIANYDEFQSAVHEARLVFATLVETIRLSEQRTGPAKPDFSRELEARVLGEQLLRLSFRWGAGDDKKPRTPKLSPEAKMVFDTLVLGEMNRIDWENTLWLKGHVEEKGWPEISEVGEKAANAAWLLVQHADHDPLFQYDALALMEPHIVEREVSRQNYAYLYDRVMLKLKGQQRYATQVTCEGGKRVPKPLEDPENVEELRAEMGLVTFAEYLTWFSGDC